jgi:hypothetical protein
MSAVNFLLSWFRTSQSVEDPGLRRLEGIRNHDLDLSTPTVSVFHRTQPSRKKVPAAL